MMKNNHLTSGYMRTIHSCALVALSLLPVCVQAGFVPTAYYVIDGESLSTTDVLNDAQAPLEVTFKANPEDLGEAIPSYEWRFVKEGSTEPYLIRYEEQTTYDFRESGTTAISLYVTYDAESEPELISTIRISISNSLLEMPNAFSPNGDGINDIYRAKSNHKSIVDFHAYIFNRWGQKLYEWTDINGGWDGNYHGSKVKAGVYYVFVRARGEDGRPYEIKRDVNVLTDYNEQE